MFHLLLSFLRRLYMTRRLRLPIGLFLSTILLLAQFPLIAQAGSRTRCNTAHPDFPVIISAMQAKSIQDAVNQDWKTGLTTKKEIGRWIFWNNQTGAFSVSPAKVGDLTTGDQDVDMGASPEDAPPLYLVGMYHTHPPNPKFPDLGPSISDKAKANLQRIPSLVIDSNPDTFDPNDYEPSLVGPAQACGDEDPDPNAVKKLPASLLNPPKSATNGTENGQPDEPKGQPEEPKEPSKPPGGNDGKGIGSSFGDPHIVTLDGFSYSFQTVGEFLLAQSKDGQFIVQTRQTAVPQRDLSLNKAVAVKIGSDRIVYYAPQSGTADVLKVNGIVQNLKDETIKLPSGALLQKKGSEYTIGSGREEQVSLRPIRVADLEFVNVTVSIPKGRQGEMMGLLGDFDGDQNNDLRGRSGKVFPQRSSYGSVKSAIANLLPIPVQLDTIETAFFEQLNRDFGNSWRLSQEEALFDYEMGQSTVSFTDQRFPRKYHSIASLLPAQIRQAESVCRDAGITSVMLQGCIMDVGLTGQSGFANSMVNALTQAVLNRAADRVLDEVRSRIKIPIPFRFPF
jgi:hypothetical protein